MTPLDELVLPVVELHEVSFIGALLNYPPLKALLPVPILALLAVPLWWFFRETWRGLDRERTVTLPPKPRNFRMQPHWRRWSRARTGESRASRLRPLATRELPLAARGETDYRPVACLIIVAIVLTLHEYYGGRSFYESTLRPLVTAFAEAHPKLRLERFDELFGYGWWVLARVIGYVTPLFLWKLLFPSDSLLDMGLRTRGFMQHIWIYAACLSVVVVAMLVLATQPEFLNYYPFYKKSSRSWFDFLAWQGMYWLQFFALELFFRGWMLAALRRTMGMAAIFVMVVPYCMIHYGKPYLEAHAAIVAGVVLGSLAMKTRSIYAGFLVHISVAVLMDTMALASRDALPIRFWPPGAGTP